MESLTIVSHWLAGMVIVYWLISYGVMWLTLSTRIVLRENSYPPLNRQEPSPKVSVIVAAKDEEQHIETCLRSLLDQDYPHYELIVVDDRSTDRTPEILRSLEKEFSGKLTVVRNHELKKGWVGKSNAMREGIQVSSGEWICMTDADCRQTSQRTLSITIQEALTNQVDFLSVTPVLDMNATWGKIIQPACVLALMTWHHPSLVNDPRFQTAYANGPFMLINRKCYNKIDGHERVKGEMNEDVLMAWHAQKEGQQIRTADNDGLFHARMYEGVDEAWKGWSRIFCGCLQSTGKLLITIATILMCIVLPWSMLVLTMAGFIIEGQAVWKELLLLWGVPCLLTLLYSHKYYSCFVMNRTWSLFFPLGGFALLGILVNSLLIYWGIMKASYGGESYQIIKGKKGELAG